MSQTVFSDRRNIALVGTYASGKTTLLESLLSVTGSLSRKGRVEQGNTVGDSSPEARSRRMTVELTVATTAYGGITFTFIDCPGSVELQQEGHHALLGVDGAIVVCEADPDRVLTLSPLLQFLDRWKIPHFIWINKLDRRNGSYAELLTALKQVSSRPIVPQQLPLWQNQQLVGFIDLVTEQACPYPCQAAAAAWPPDLGAEEQAARADMLETLADYDDLLLEELLEDRAPSPQEILTDLRLDLGADLIVPVLLGVAQADYGVKPLLEALVRQAPSPQVTAQHRGIAASGEPLAQVLKTFYSPQAGKMSLVRVWRGDIKDGDSLKGDRLGGIYDLFGSQSVSLTQASAGQIVAIARLEQAQTGDTLSPANSAPDPLPTIARLDPVYALALTPVNRGDDVKLSGAMAKLLEEDPSLAWEYHGDTHDMILWGQGDGHLALAMDRLSRKYNLAVTSHLPQVAYRETIGQATPSAHGRYKHQSGGHGQFGEVYLALKPRSRGQGFSFNATIAGGVVPRQYIPSVETGVRDYLNRGPLGFPVVDVAVTLIDGSYHSVDSSDMAFKQAARLAMQEGMVASQPILLEPIAQVYMSVPNRYTANVLKLMSGRRGQILNYQAKADWPGWDLVSAYVPQAEMQTMVVDLRSLTMGVGFFHWTHDHLDAVPEKLQKNILTNDPGRP
ncbi:MAG: elongation factor G [Cyanobacteria bacterium REEB459]|nr:elongation factor G [Cyanobacteria bacterium REEB459]